MVCQPMGQLRLQSFELALRVQVVFITKKKSDVGHPIMRALLLIDVSAYG